MAVQYLHKCNLLDDLEKAVMNCGKCGSVMQNKRRLIRGNSVRHGNSFFHYSDLNNKMNCKLSLCQILDVVYFFLCETPIKYAETITGR
jgi:hypothetical protein